MQHFWFWITRIFPPVHLGLLYSESLPSDQASHCSSKGEPRHSSIEGLFQPSSSAVSLCFPSVVSECFLEVGGCLWVKSVTEYVLIDLVISLVSQIPGLAHSVHARCICLQVLVTLWRTFYFKVIVVFTAKSCDWGFSSWFCSNCLQPLATTQGIFFFP